MMMKKAIFNTLTTGLVAASIFGNPNKSTAQFLNSGKIRYEKTTNLSMMLKKPEYDWIKQYLQNPPKTYSSNFDLYFNNDQVAYLFVDYVKGAEVAKNFSNIGGENKVFTKFKTDSAWAKINLFGEEFNTADSLPKYDWKILSEVRNINGYSCRKAVTKICDSVVVVAFYADAIPVSTGPERFGGLPGMIMELSIPRLYTTWLATSIDSTALDNNNKNFVSNIKGKTNTHVDLIKKIKDQYSSQAKTEREKNYFAQIFWWMSL